MWSPHPRRRYDWTERYPAIAIFSATTITGSQPAPSTADRPNFAAEYRDKVAAKMTAAQVAEAQRLAREWKPK